MAGIWTRRSSLVPAMVIVLSTLTSACGLGGSSPTSSTTPTNPAQVMLTLIKDSSRLGPSSGDAVTMMFGGSGDTYLLLTSNGGDLSYQGTYIYSNHTLGLRFTSSGFSRQGSASLDFTSGEVVLPFQAFSAKPGSSSWNVIGADPSALGQDVAEAVAEESTSGVNPNTLIDDAAAAIAAASGAPVSDGPGFPSIIENLAAPEADNTTVPGVPGVPGLLDRAAPGPHAAGSAPTQPTLGHFAAPQPATVLTASRQAAQNLSQGITQIQKLPTDVLMTNKDGLSVSDDIDSQIYNATSYFSSFSENPFSQTPTIDTSLPSPNNGISDPASKHAVLFLPFLDVDQRSWTLNNGTLTMGGSDPLPDPNADKEQALLIGDGYSVRVETDQHATVQNLIEDLTEDGTPGFFDFSTHGSSVGSLTTNTFLGNTKTAADNAAIKMAKSLGAPISDFVTAVDKVGDYDPDNVAYYLAVMPGFWTWLQTTHSVRFNKSFVMINACLTDATPNLRKAIHSAAYFAYDVAAQNDFADAVEFYTISLMVRPTFTPEEVFYNLVRLARTGQIVYNVDTIMETALPKQVIANKDAKTDGGVVRGTSNIVANALDGWGYDGSSDHFVPYLYSGWLSKNIFGGQVFTLLVAARGSANPSATQGAANLKICWDAWWKNKQLPGVSSPYCQQANAGQPPTVNEYDYAVDLLTGQKDVGGTFTDTYVPRFTLNDAGTA